MIWNNAILQGLYDGHNYDKIKSKDRGGLYRP